MIKDQLPFDHDNYYEVNHNFNILGGWNTAASTHVIGLLPMFYYNPFIELVITTSEPNPVNFTVSSLDETLYTGTVTAGTPTNIIDNNNTLLPYMVNSESDRYKGILVTTGSQKKISVTVALVEFQGSIGAYLTYPAWGYSVNSYVYYAVSTSTKRSDTFSSLLIVSANDNTNITITPSVTVTVPSDLSPTGNDTILNPGQSITIQLQYLETLLVRPVTALADLTGTKVESNKPISVYSGHTCGSVDLLLNKCDVFGEQLPPVASWGNEFLVQLFYNRSSGYVLKLVGSQNDTIVVVTCNDCRDYSFSLQEGVVLVQNITQTSCYINSTKPILVAQFSFGWASNDQLQHGDVAMTVIPPLNHYTNNVTSFPLISLFSNVSSYVNLAVQAVIDSSQIKLNGNLLPSLTSSSWKHYNSSSSVGGYFVFDSYNLTEESGEEISIWSDNYSDKIVAMVFGMARYMGYSCTGDLNLRPSGGTFRVCSVHTHVCYILDFVIINTCVVLFFPTFIQNINGSAFLCV